MSEQSTKNSASEKSNKPRAKDVQTESKSVAVQNAMVEATTKAEDIDTNRVEVQTVDNTKKSGTSGVADSGSAFAQEALRVIKNGAVKVREGTKVVREEADRLIDKTREIYKHPPEWVVEPFRRQHKFKPPADFAIKRDAYEISVDLPGVKKENISVKLAGGMITISGQKRSNDTGEGDKGYLVQELNYGEFERILRVPSDSDPSQVEARFENGVLMLKLPKIPSVAVPDREIEVRSS